MSLSDGLTYLVQTTLGNTLLHDGAKPLVNMMGDTYLPVRVQDLKEGQMILYLKEHIDKTLEEVVPVLEKSARYVAARDAMHVKDSQGRTVTRLRRDLITSFGKDAGVENLETRLYGAMGDFDEAEYGKMIDMVEAVLKNAGVEHQYHRTTLKSWLDGSTLAPLDWSVFDALAKQLAAFADYRAPEKQLKEHYSLYVTVRKGIMRYLTTKGKEPPKSQHGKEQELKRKGGSLKLEIDLVVEEFMEDISAQYALAQVTSVQRLTPGDLQRPSRPDVRLHDGVITGKIEDEHVRLISYAQINTHKNLLDGVLTFVIEDYLQRAPDNAFTKALRDAGLPVYRIDAYDHSMIIGLLLRRHSKTAGASDGKMIAMMEKSWGNRVNLRRMTVKFAEEMQDGTMDGVLGLEGGAVMRAHRTLDRLVVAIPEIVYELDGLPGLVESGRMTKPVGERRMRELETRLLDEYRFNLDETKTLLTYGFSVMTGGRRNYKPSVAYRDPEFMDNVARSVAEKEQLKKVLTKDESKHLLDEYGFGALMAFVPEPVWAADAWRNSS